MVNYLATTTIQVSRQLKSKLDERKLSAGESYEEVIWSMLEDTMELSSETIRDIEKARAQARKGKTYSLSQVKEELGL